MSFMSYCGSRNAPWQDWGGCLAHDSALDSTRVEMTRDDEIRKGGIREKQDVNNYLSREGQREMVSCTSPSPVLCNIA